MRPDPRPGIDYLPDNFQPPPATPWPLWLQIVVFAALFALLQGAWSFAQGTVLEHVAVGDWTVTPAAHWIQIISPQLGAQAWGYSIKAPGGGINVLNGCEGFEVIFLWLAALAVTPMAPGRRLLGLPLGLLLIWALNQVRIVALFYVYRSDRELFALLHGTVAPLLLIVCVTVAFAVLVMTPGRPAHS